MDFRELQKLLEEFLTWCDENPYNQYPRPPDLLQFAWWLKHVKEDE